VNKAKPFSISKEVVWEAYKRVKANKGAAGVDEVTIKEFEGDLKNNLYKLWNRMSSGSYSPPSVRRVEIEKEKGGKRILGVPCVSDRVAQMVVKMYLEPKVEPYFHKDSYGYRPNKSATEAVGTARQRCWRYKWVIDLDIRAFFDNLDHKLMMRAVRKHTDCKWILLYVERWLKAPMQTETGEITYINREKGTAQGSVVSPLLSNLFLHYALDLWLSKNYPHNPFERYADDAIVHCTSEAEAKKIRSAIEGRLAQCKLELHPQKTKIVYCSRENQQRYPNEKFDFLGYTFQTRWLKSKFEGIFVTFSPAVSDEALKSMSQTVRSWRLHLRSDKSLDELSGRFDPVLRGWVNYYGKYYKSALHPMLYRINLSLTRWATRKYKKLRGRRGRATHWMGRIARQRPQLFAHWQAGLLPVVE